VIVNVRDDEEDADEMILYDDENDDNIDLNYRDEVFFFFLRSL